MMTNLWTRSSTSPLQAKTILPLSSSRLLAHGNTLDHTNQENTNNQQAMPFWESPQINRSTLEHTPLSTREDDADDVEEGDSLPPYSDIPRPPLHTTTTTANETNGGGGLDGSANGSKKTHKAISIVDDDDEPFMLRRNRRNSNRNNNSYDDGFVGDIHNDADDEYGGDYSSTTNTPSKHRHQNPTKRYYRSSLLYAYLHHWFTCRCITNNSSNCKLPKRVLMMLFYIFLLMVILLCSSGIGYIIAQDGSPFVPDEVVANGKDVGSANSGSGSSSTTVTTNNNSGGKQIFNKYNKLPPPPSNLHNICSDWITQTGRQKCQDICNASACCSLPQTDKNSCWEEQADDCATYRSGCMGYELYGYVDGNNNGDDGDEGDERIVDNEPADTPLSSKTQLPPPPLDLPNLCSPLSLQTPTGFNSCSTACRPSRCCHPEVYECAVLDESEISESGGESYCEGYEGPCGGVVESWRGSGHAVGGGVGGGDGIEDTNSNQVMLQCNSAK
jgi:hypothetical protein